MTTWFHTSTDVTTESIWWPSGVPLAPHSQWPLIMRLPPRIVHRHFHAPLARNHVDGSEEAERRREILWRNLADVGEGKSPLETQMLLNHKAAMDFLVEQAEYVGFNRHTILSLHALLADNLLDPRACGRLRTAPVSIGGTTYHPPEIPQLIDECFRHVLETATAIEDPFEQAFFAMVQLPYLQPFLDVNKRVSRLVAILPLISDNLCPLSFIDVPNRDYIDGTLGIYELDRVELLRDVFCWAYERSCARYSAVRQSLGEPDPFRLRYRRLIAHCVRDVVTKLMDKKTTSAWLRRRVPPTLPPADGARRIDVVETEVVSLHEGNIARFRLSPPEFEAWKKIWR